MSNKLNSGASEADKIRDAKEKLNNSASRNLPMTANERKAKEQKTPFRNDPRRSKPR